jgi:hypothetical protein
MSDSDRGSDADRAPGSPDGDEVDPLAPGESVDDEDDDDAVEPNEPA